MSEPRSSATVSLMRIALGIDLAVLFFGVLTIRGLGVIPELWVWVGGAVALVWLLLALGTIRTAIGVWMGHLFHVSLLAGFAIDIAVGLSVLVPIGFWLFAVIRGPQLDKLAGEASEDS